MNKRNTLSFFASLIFLGATVTACLDEENPIITNGARITRFTATVNGQQERPTSTTSTATGTFAGVLNETTRVLSYTVTHTFPTSATLIGGHLHRITPNATNGNGPVEIPFSSLASPIIGQATLATQTRVDSMRNGFYYVNLHTPTYPAGEIRGDIRPQ